MAIVPLNNTLHADMKIKAGIDYSLMENQHILPLVAHEFGPASTDYPITFVKNTDSGQFQPVAMLGLKPGENLFYKDGQWTGNYVPGIVTSSPFKLMASPEDNNRLMIAIDDSSELLGKDEGDLFFNEDGTESETFAQRKKALISYFEHGQITQGFVKILTDLDLLVERSISMTIEDEGFDITGLYMVDEKKLNELDDEKFLDLKKRGLLAVIYTHLNSLHQMNRLAAIKSGVR